MNNLYLCVWFKLFIIGFNMVWINLVNVDMGFDLFFNLIMNCLKDLIIGFFFMLVVIIMIVVICLMLVFGEWGDGFKKLINIVLWLLIVFFVMSFVIILFGV